MRVADTGTHVIRQFDLQSVQALGGGMMLLACLLFATGATGIATLLFFGGILVVAIARLLAVARQR